MLLKSPKQIASSHADPTCTPSMWLSHYITRLSKVDRWFSLEHFQTTKYNSTSLKQGDRFFFFCTKIRKFRHLWLFVNPPFSSKAGSGTGPGYDSSQQFLTSRKEEGREGFKINMLKAPELKQNGQRQVIGRNWRLWASDGRPRTHTKMLMLRAPGYILVPGYISEKAEDKRRHSHAFQHFISGWSAWQSWGLCNFQYAALKQAQVWNVVREGSSPLEYDVVRRSSPLVYEVVGEVFSLSVWCGREVFSLVCEWSGGLLL